MAELEQIGGQVRSELALTYLRRPDVDGNEVEAVARLAHDLMRGDPTTYKVGYTRENALAAALELFPDVTTIHTVERRLTELLSEVAPPEGVLGLTPFENDLVARALGAGEPLNRDERAHLVKVARLAEMRREEVRDRVAALCAVIRNPPEGAAQRHASDEAEAIALELEAMVRVYEEATTALLEAVSSSTREVESRGDADA